MVSQLSQPKSITKDPQWGKVAWLFNHSLVFIPDSIPWTGYLWNGFLFEMDVSTIEACQAFALQKEEPTARAYTTITWAGGDAGVNKPTLLPVL